MPEVIRPYSGIEYLVADRVATITLSRPDHLNAFTQVMRDELIDAFDQADSDDDVRAVVVTGRGFGFVFARRGLVMEAASSWFLPRVVGISQALEWVGTGRVFDAAGALRGGLVARTYPADELLPAAYALAREIADHTSAVAIATSRQLMWRMLGADSPWEAHRLDSKGIYLLGQAPDVVEGVTAFLDKRPPHFPMRVGTDLPDLGPRWPEPPGPLA